MGMYTELIFGAELKKDTPNEVIEALKYMLRETETKPTNFPLPDGRCEWLFCECKQLQNLKVGLLPDVSSRFIYLITNETDGIVESAWSNFEEAKRECQQWEKMKPQKQFMVVELPINGC
jgi:hypothetical protein